METTLERTTLSIRVRNDIKEKAKELAKKEHRSLSNYIEFLILQEDKKQQYQEIYRIPNATTLEAMQEALNAKNSEEEVDLSSNDNFLKSMGI